MEGWAKIPKIEISLNGSDSRKTFLCNNLGSSMLNDNTKFGFWGTNDSFTIDDNGISYLNVDEVLITTEDNLFHVKLTYTWDKQLDKWVVRDWKAILDNTNIIEIKGEDDYSD